MDLTHGFVLRPVFRSEKHGKMFADQIIRIIAERRDKCPIDLEDKTAGIQEQDTIPLWSFKERPIIIVRGKTFTNVYICHARTLVGECKKNSKIVAILERPAVAISHSPRAFAIQNILKPGPIVGMLFLLLLLH